MGSGVGSIRSLRGALLVLAVGVSGCSGCSKERHAHDHAASTASPAASGSSAAAAATAPPAGPVEPVSVTLPKTAWPAPKQALHVLNRLAFGPRPGEIESVAAAGVAAWIGRQLRPAGVADRAVDGEVHKLRALSMSIADLHETYPLPKPMAAPSASASGAAPAPPPGSAAPAGSAMGPPATEPPGVMLREIVAQKVLRATESERQLQEVLVDFWFNHFNVAFEKVRWYLIPYERDAIRPHVFGRFRDLLGATAHHPAMLHYLDNAASVAEEAARDGGTKKARGLNENYGRELLELHTLGVDGGYTQGDVTQTARAFTGWGIAEPNKASAFVFRARQHDKDPKQVLGKSFTAGGEQDGEQVLDLLAAHPATARFVARKLCEKFHSDHPPAALVSHVAEVFTRSGGDLTSTYVAIFTAPEFWSDAAFRSMTKTPLELVASSLRAVGAKSTDPERAGREVDKLGEVLYRCAPPTGYKQTSDAWVNTGGLLGRLNFGMALGAGRIKGTTYDRDLLVGNPPPDDDEGLVDHMAENVLHTPLSAATRAVILRELAQSKDHIVYQEPSPRAAPLVLGLLLGSPEMQKQ